jgi:hypothetical protein
MAEQQRALSLAISVNPSGAAPRRGEATTARRSACDEIGFAVTQFGRPPVLGFNEQIFGADEQVSAGLVQKMHSVSN